ncbi:hypothetical protein G6F65_022800 [Rhizopus arrhizus]|nr:hypothetical protein G6F65_022800 [Rhizopus arrhizus]
MQHAVLITVAAELRIAATADVQGVVRERQAQLMLDSLLQRGDRLARRIGSGSQAPVVGGQGQLAGGRRDGRSGHGGRSFARGGNRGASLKQRGACGRKEDYFFHGSFL